MFYKLCKKDKSHQTLSLVQKSNDLLIVKNKFQNLIFITITQTLNKNQFCINFLISCIIAR